MKKSITTMATTLLLFGGVSATVEPIRDVFLMSCESGYTMAEDQSCVADVVVPETPPVTIVLPSEGPAEDDPEWDCRIHGNQRCGVEIKGVWYVIDFVNGEPVSVEPRGF